MSPWIAPNLLSDSSCFPEASGTQAKAFFDAACEIDRRAGPDAGKDPSPGSQAGAVEAWARASGTLISDAEIDVLPVVSNSTSEHEVFFRPWKAEL
ncbi:MAG: hypothetical protein WDO13_01140 [Verrucomicrobiota bacterium]